MEHWLGTFTKRVYDFNIIGMSHLGSEIGAGG